MECDTYLKIWTHKSLESCSCYRVFWKQCFVGIHTMLIGDTFLPLFGLDQDPRSKIGSRPYLFHLRNSSRLLCVQYWSDWKRFSTGENSIFFTRTKTCKLNFTPRKLGKTLALTLNKKGYIWKINVDNSIKLGCANLLKKRLNISRTCL